MEKSTIEWPSAVVAAVLLLVIGAITIEGIRKYESTAEALEIWSSLTPLIGLITGAFVTYFFTRGALQTAQMQAHDATLLAAKMQERADVTQRALLKVAGAVESEQWRVLLETDPTLRAAIGGGAEC